MNKFPKISIVTPSFNQGQYIEQTILSVLNQDYKNIELIIIDGGSTDETISILKKYDSQIAYWVSEKDNGQAHAINKGLEKVTGDVFNWLNSDDYLEPGALQAVANAFNKNNKTEVVCGFTHCFWEIDKTTSHTYRMGIEPTVAKTIHPVKMNQPGSFYKTDIVRDLAGINESLRYVFDDELWFRYCCKYGLANIAEIENVLVHFRLHDASKSVGEGFDGFNVELQHLYIDIAKQANAPAWLIEGMEEHLQSCAYKSKGNWDLTHLESEAFFASFAQSQINRLYSSHQIAAAKQAMQWAIDYGYFKWNRMMTSLRLKLLMK